MKVIDLLLRECAKSREKETQFLTTQTFIKTYNVQQSKHRLRLQVNETITFELQGIRWELSMMTLSYKSTKGTKTEKF